MNLPVDGILPGGGVADCPVPGVKQVNVCPAHVITLDEFCKSGQHSIATARGRSGLAFRLHSNHRTSETMF